MFATQMKQRVTEKFENQVPENLKNQRVAFRNILFATDFSASANAAMPYAAGLARSFAAKLFVLHVQEPANYALPVEAMQCTQFAQEMEMKFIRKAVAHDFPEIVPEVLQAEGALWPSLSEAVKTHHIDLVVIGTRGRTGVGKALLGSKAEEILRHAPCPVLTVGPRAQFQDGVRAKLVSILFATDFGPASIAAAPFAVSLAEEYQSKLTLLHVESRNAAPVCGADEFGDASERRLRALVPDDAKFWCAPHFLVEQGVPTDRILEAARRTNADLIVIGAHRPEGIPGAASHLPISTLHKIVANAEVPVLSVRG